MSVDFSFDAEAPDAVEVARKAAAKMVTEITDETEKNLRVLITQALKDQVSVFDAAEAIHDLIGLTSAQGQAVTKYRAQLAGSGLSATKVDQKVADYADELLTSRAETIARYEVMEALNAGQNEAWAQAQEAGILTEGATKEWILSEDPCPECEAAAREGPVPVTQEFKDGDPPLHPRCRCTTGIATP